MNKENIEKNASADVDALVKAQLDDEHIRLTKKHFLFWPFDLIPTVKMDEIRSFTRDVVNEIAMLAPGYIQNKIQLVNRICKSHGKDYLGYFKPGLGNSSGFIEFVSDVVDLECLRAIPKKLKIVACAITDRNLFYCRDDGRLIAEVGEYVRYVSELPNKPMLLISRTVVSSKIEKEFDRSLDVKFFGFGEFESALALISGFARKEVYVVAEPEVFGQHHHYFKMVQLLVAWTYGDDLTSVFPLLSFDFKTCTGRDQEHLSERVTLRSKDGNGFPAKFELRSFFIGDDKND